MSQSYIIDQSHYGHIAVTGEDRGRFMQGMVTADLNALSPGQWTRACLLTVKGKVVSVFEVVVEEDRMVLHCEAHLRDKTIEALSRYAIVDDVEFTALDMPLFRVWSDAASVWDAPPLGQRPQGELADEARVEELRICAGMPSYGRDVSEENFPFESPLARYISYDKGCYIGQEPVARVNSRGNASRALVGLRVEGQEPLELGAVVSHPMKDKAGIVGSSVVSPDLGVIALAYLHRSVLAGEHGDGEKVGDEVSVGGRSATVCSLPITH